MKIRIGTRGSKLALWQAKKVRDVLAREFKNVKFEIVTIRTKGDIISENPLVEIGEKGLFVKEIETALLKREIEIAVHSLKDLPTKLPEGLVLAAALPRDDPRDVFISEKYNSISELPKGAKIGTSSLRRKSQLLSLHPDLNIVPLRGNVDTRIRKLKEGRIDGIVLASAGLKRLGMEKLITEYLPINIMVPSVGQGVIALETREDLTEIRKMLSKINHAETFSCIIAEREFAKEIGAGCHVPVGAFCWTDADVFNMIAYVGDLEGKNFVRKSALNFQTPKELGKELAHKVLMAGGERILQELRG